MNVGEESGEKIRKDRKTVLKEERLKKEKPGSSLTSTEGKKIEV